MRLVRTVCTAALLWAAANALAGPVTDGVADRTEAQRLYVERAMAAPAPRVRVHAMRVFAKPAAESVNQARSAVELAQEGARPHGVVTGFHVWLQDAFEADRRLAGVAAPLVERPLEALPAAQPTVFRPTATAEEIDHNGLSVVD